MKTKRIVERYYKVPTDTRGVYERHATLAKARKSRNWYYQDAKGSAINVVTGRPAKGVKAPIVKVTVTEEYLEFNRNLRNKRADTRLE